MPSNLPDCCKCPACNGSIVLTPEPDHRKCFICGHEWVHVPHDEAAAHDAAPDQEPAAPPPPPEQQ